jgi:hypothetical protein
VTTVRPPPPDTSEVHRAVPAPPSTTAVEYHHVRRCLSVAHFRSISGQRRDGDLDAPSRTRQLALGPEPLDVARGDRGVVDDHAGGLHARPARTRRDVVDRRCGRLGERRDIVEKRG